MSLTAKARSGFGSIGSVFVFFLSVIVGGLVQIPIVSLEVVSLFLYGWSWYGVGLAVLGLLLASAINIVASMNLFVRPGSSGTPTLELVDFLGKFERTEFTLLDNRTFLTQVLGEREALQHFPELVRGGQGFKSLFRSMLANEGSLRLVSVEASNRQEAEFPLQLVAFTSFNGAWIFLPFKAEEMTGLQKFQLFHELGHVSGSSLIRQALPSADRLYALALSIPILLLRADELLALCGVLGAVMAFEFLRLHLARKRSREFRLLEEIEADRFAFSCSKKSWFKDYPAAAVARRLCSDGSFSAVENEKRFEAFVAELQSLRGDETSKAQVQQYVGDREMWLEKVVPWLAAGLLLTGGTFYAAPSGLHLLLFSAACVIFLFISLTSIKTAEYFEALMATNVGDLARHDWVLVQAQRHRRYLLALSRMRPTGERSRAFYRMVARYIGQTYRERDAKGAESSVDDPLAPGTSQVLFTPDELDIFINTTLPPRAWIFYGKELAQTVTALEYHSEKHWVRVRLAGRPPMDLGVKIQWLIRPYWEDSTQVTIARTRNRQIIASYEVPLQTVES